MRGGKYRAVAAAEDWGRVVVATAEPLVEGHTMEAYLKCHQPEAPRFDFAFDERRYLKGKGIPFTCLALWLGKPSPPHSASGKVRSWIRMLRDAMMARYDALPEGDARALIIALASGDRSRMGYSLRRSFSDLGLGHMTAVSGFHTGIVAGILLLVLRWSGIPRRWMPWVLTPSLWLFVGLCGFPQSAVRALGMATMTAWGFSLGRRPEVMTLLAFVGMSMWAASPYLVGDLGVSLSFLATAGILALHQRFTRMAELGTWARRWGLAVAVPVVATACTAPIAWPAFGKIPSLFLPANLLAAPWVTALAGMTAAWWMVPPPFAEPLEGLLLGAAELLIQGVRNAGDAKVILLPLQMEVVRLAGASMAIGTFLALRRRGMLIYMLAGLLTACSLLRSQHFMERAPRRFPFQQGEVSFDGEAWVVFPDAPRKDMKWETRSLLERVSHHPPEYARWCGTRLSFSRNELRYRQRDRSWSWVSSSRTHCGSPDPHRLPRPPCP